MQTSYGPVNVQDFGTILVPGKSDDSRIAYAQSLFYKVGVFIPINAPRCTVITVDQSPNPVTSDKFLEPIIALGTLNDYICIDALNLPKAILFNQNFYLFDGLIDNLLSFNSYILPFYNRMYHGNPPSDAWIWRVLDINQWLTMERKIRNIPNNTVVQILQLLAILSDRARENCQIDLRNDDPVYRQALVDLMQIIPDLIIAEPDYDTVDVIYSDKLPVWCDAAQSFDLLLKKINLIYGTFGTGVARRGLTLTGDKKAELLETQPAILYQPGGYATQLYRQQGPWAKK